MNTKLISRGDVRTGAFILGCLFLGLAPLTAEFSTGKLNGRISELETGRSLQGAMIQVSGTNIVDFTDVEGKFRLNSVPSGEQELSLPASTRKFHIG